MKFEEDIDNDRQLLNNVYRAKYIGKENWPDCLYEVFDQGLDEVLVIQCNSFSEKYIQRSYFQINFQRI
jgi:hypothetical protein